MLSFIVIFIYGKKNEVNKIIKYIPLTSVVTLFIGVFVISNYYQGRLNEDETKFLKLQSLQFLYDSVSIDRKAKLETIDSLKNLNQELRTILATISKQEKVIGDRDNLKDRVKSKIVSTQQEIWLIESYNEIIDIPKSLEAGYSTTGTTSNFTFNCPTDSISDFIDLKLQFQDSTLVHKIACIYVDVFEVKAQENLRLFDQAYKPQKGINAIRLRNFLKKPNTRINIGYVLKSEIDKKYPHLELMSCKSNITP
ncbi:MAG TPA: hypothetical protein DGG95_15975 [Cytophagales bacterium]|nr:hypothetical protein [Cytophagales bacterium]